MHNNNTIVGRPTKAIEPSDLKRSAKGTAILNLSIAQTKGKRGTPTERPQFFDVTCFGTLAENLVKSGITTRDVLMVVGTLDFRQWTAPDGTKRNAVSTIADFVGPDMTFATVDVERNPLPNSEGDPGVAVPEGETDEDGAEVL